MSFGLFTTIIFNSCLKGEASALGNIGLIYRTKSKLDKALKYQQEALVIRRFLWRMLSEFATPQPLSEFAVAGERIYAATHERVWGIDIGSEYLQVPRFQMAVSDARSIAVNMKVQSRT